ncbi:hypothetical protein FKM82_019131 [Ascaphus truei]
MAAESSKWPPGPGTFHGSFRLLIQGFCSKDYFVRFGFAAKHIERDKGCGLHVEFKMAATTQRDASTIGLNHKYGEVHRGLFWSELSLDTQRWNRDMCGILNGPTDAPETSGITSYHHTECGKESRE